MNMQQLGQRQTLMYVYPVTPHKPFYDTRMVSIHLGNSCRSLWKPRPSQTSYCKSPALKSKVTVMFADSRVKKAKMVVFVSAFSSKEKYTDTNLVHGDFMLKRSKQL